MESRDFLIESFPRSEAEARDAMAVIENRHVNKLEAGVLLDNYGTSAILLSDQTRKG